ncbi:hypothetical protein A4A49_51206 [Nicotiana attenuata]|uniref:Replication factor A C-terminal domain-containing protein n=1 Tax=Nicotiana attenuata TaxID=49451 RepID=A0A1J6I5L6_NICAT|nr:hypothetical protein A4A49_51206 [Nicotiana attenuata]
MNIIGSVSLLLWDRKAMFLIGKSENKLKKGLLENAGDVDKSSYPVELNNILERKFIFKVTVKRSNIQMQDEVYNVVSFTNEEHLIKKYTHAPHSDTFPICDRCSQIS